MEETHRRRRWPHDDSLRIVSMNIAEAIPSQEAPASWKDSATNELQLQALLHEVLKQDPDILALQECPGGMNWANSVFGKKPSPRDDRKNDNKNDTMTAAGDYVAVASAWAHAGQVVLLVRKDMEPLVSPVRKDLLTELPVAMVRLQVPTVADAPPDNNNNNNNSSVPSENHPHRVATTTTTQLVVAAVHLEPFERGSFGRREQVQELLAAAAFNSSKNGTPDHEDDDVALVFAGDTNMRDTEDVTMEQEFHLLDVWKETGSNPATRYTWDTTAHQVRVVADEENSQNDGGDNNNNRNNKSAAVVQQNLYYGADTRAYQRRYDRIYMTHAAAEHVMHPRSFSLLANRPIPPSQTHFLSDHFGITAEFDIIASRSRANKNNNDNNNK